VHTHPNLGDRNARQFTLAASSALLAPSLSRAQALNIQTMVSGLDAPWAFGFAAGGILITERDGQLLWISRGDAR